MVLDPVSYIVRQCDRLMHHNPYKSPGEDTEGYLGEHDYGGNGDPIKRKEFGRDMFLFFP